MSKKTKTKSILFGGYEAKTCKEKIRKKYDPIYEDVFMDENTSGDVHRMNSGIAFEIKIGELWKKSLKDSLYIIPARADDNSKEREELTLKLMQNPGKVKVIWNARLPKIAAINKVGEPDALILVEKSKKGNKWTAVDVKDHRVYKSGEGNKKFLISNLELPFYSDAVEMEFTGAGVLQLKDAIQLSHYYRMLQHLGFATDKPLGGIIGREEIIVWHHLDNKSYKDGNENVYYSALEHYDEEFKIRLDIAKAAKKGKALAEPLWSSDCPSCEFRTVCKDELKEKDHITLLPGITPNLIKPFYNNGVLKISQIAKLSHRTAKIAEFIDVESLVTDAKLQNKDDLVSSHFDEKVSNFLSKFDIKFIKDINKLDIKSAKLSKEFNKSLPDLIDQARAYTTNKVLLARDLTYVDLPRAYIEEDIDIEDDNGFVYLIGVNTTIRSIHGDNKNVNSTYHSFVTWDRTPESEAKVFADFWAHIQNSKDIALKKRKKNGYMSYHFHTHERTAFIRLAEKHAGYPGVPSKEDVESFINSGFFVDMHKVLTQQLIWPTMAKTLKELAKWTRFSWRDNDPGGGNSLAWYDRAVNSTDDIELQVNRDRLLDYNADDVAAQIHLRNWLSRLSDDSKQLGSRIQSAKSLEKRFNSK